MTIRIKGSKTDPFRQGVNIRIAATSNNICPVGSKRRTQDPGGRTQDAGLRKSSQLSFLLNRKEEGFFERRFINEFIVLYFFFLYRLWNIPLLKQDFILEYKGELISNEEAENRRTNYEKDGLGCFLYDGVSDIDGRSRCLDATLVEGYGKYVNDSPDYLANAVMKRRIVDQRVCLYLVASQDIKEGTEIRTII
ncbi:uncharacterized protein [Clytia hemisphaerica]|uniref:uncharacterized protein n=1 Tax=Clytia hemisphaerica TaxID=252671 RepID=UPI0034D523AA